MRYSTPLYDVTPARERHVAGSHVGNLCQVADHVRTEVQKRTTVRAGGDHRRAPVSGENSTESASTACNPTESPSASKE